MAYTVVYDAPDGPRTYCEMGMTRIMAEKYLEKFRAKYLNADGSGREYPNKQGFYPFTNPRIVELPNHRGQVFAG